MMHIRSVCSQDQPLIERLLRSEHRVLHYTSWWWREHLDDPLFVIAERGADLAGALLVCADEMPVAWVRWGLLDPALDAADWLDQVLPPVLDNLRAGDVPHLALLDDGRWADFDLAQHGFERFETVLAMQKTTRAFPPLRPTPAHLRPGVMSDVPAIWQIERAAFLPHWWHSQDTLRRGLANAACVVVAEVEDRLVGYACGKVYLPVAHLDRIVVHPAYQNQGIGAQLLQDVLQSFCQAGVDCVLLNTQASNHTALHLYRRFGFRVNGDYLIVWDLAL